ncbi:D-aminoacyl-tRNA deacylase [Staphylococcus carnosus]|uniref:D-aminoacyl-tRNA deacylase n=1 Tax=Staphylococcus carnosus (strain TM300) TaxID=396513 RepID=DTD_STACT|nr:D-aminoacyl-tRNA deacylase [Staphylococcus carnosus]B9DNG1.1 RecName: Full=D-aminoacyl-tRNA deacylase; Short=DTD; AltName: Full=Gly-tRNA(Ala) deacylase [Staphylococcus carnosus subsp. carnosus TM300]QPT04274.1 D-tyrosyl-tRNA(Tyr) deacylase [Staphylococcus carnosus]UQA66999.1 D-tyrosyl-tRNA(Tyr) deacylase [Staphylococcus carnosus]UTB78164.1 D-tyrosyl-tRNA(Tyr) deacylase [Staphylococcus carnosus]UTB87711.1 D-tyrosyl-tRNA(Tyr) deacylase [Staphylococcus carnosus]UTB90062.1 D-tyrosyl-tRNA(Tyr) 
MKIVVQRVKQASVTNESIHEEIGKGLCLLVGVGQDSTEKDVEAVAKKIVNARIFEDENGKLNLNVQQVGGAILSISQFTLYADVKKGNRPGFTNSKPPEEANRLYEAFNEALCQYGVEVKTGEFGTDMLVDIANDGPVTIIYESQDGKII